MPEGKRLKNKDDKNLLLINDILLSVSRHLHIEDVVNTFLLKLVELRDFSTGMVYLLDDKNQQFNLLASLGFIGDSAEGMELNKINYDLSQIRSEKYFLNEQIFFFTAKHFQFLEKEGIISYAFFPLFSKGNLLGLLFIGSKKQPLSDEDIYLLLPLSTQLSVFIENSVLYLSLQKQLLATQLLLKVNESINSSISEPHKTLLAIIEGSVGILSADYCDITLFDHDNLKAYCAFNPSFLRTSENFAFQKSCDQQGKCYNEYAYFTDQQKCITNYKCKIPFQKEENTKITAVSDIKNQFLDSDLKIKMLEAGFSSFLTVPLLWGAETLGNLSVYHRTNWEHTPYEIEIARNFANQAAIAVRNVQLIEEINKKSTELEAKNKELESFVNVVSHDLKTPLISIQGLSSILLEENREKLNSEAVTLIKRILNNTDKMDELIKDLLDLSKIGRIIEEYEDVNILHLIEDALLQMEQTLKQKNIKVIIKGEFPVIKLEKKRLRQVFINLVD